MSVEPGDRERCHAGRGLRDVTKLTCEHEALVRRRLGVGGRIGPGQAVRVGSYLFFGSSVLHV